MQLDDQDTETAFRLNAGPQCVKMLIEYTTLELLINYMHWLALMKSGNLHAKQLSWRSVMTAFRRNVMNAMVSPYEYLEFACCYDCFQEECDECIG